MPIPHDSFYYCEPKNTFNMEGVKEFIKDVNAVSFKRCRTKNSHNFWQIFCFNKMNKPCGVILTKSQKVRLLVYKDITK